MLALLRGTRTASGLKVTAEWSENTYRRGVVLSDAEMAELKIEHHSTCPQWNYTIKPRDSSCSDLLAFGELLRLLSTEVSIVIVRNHGHSYSSVTWF